MKYKVKKTNQQRGIGLLELMLSVSILALMVLASVMYFNSVAENTKTMALAEMVSDIKHAAKTYAASNDLSTISMDNMIKAKILTANYAHTPWWAGDEGSNDITVSAARNDPNAITITLNDMLPAQCEKLQDRIKAAQLQSESISCRDNTITYIIYDSPTPLMKPSDDK